MFFPRVEVNIFYPMAWFFFAEFFESLIWLECPVCGEHKSIFLEAAWPTGSSPRLLIWSPGFESSSLSLDLCLVVPDLTPRFVNSQPVKLPPVVIFK